MNGTSATTFEPDGTITRAMAGFLLSGVKRASINDDRSYCRACTAKRRENDYLRLCTGKSRNY